jgi:hypothetical protein
MPRENEDDYEVGYGRPPCHTRFVKGQSGNPRGRPPGAKNLSTLLSEALNETVIVTENGGRRKVTKRQAIVTQLVNRSATADFRAIKILLDLPTEVERRVAQYRASFDKLADQNLPLEILDQLACLGEMIASEDGQLPEEVRTEFALKGLEAGARARALAARNHS